MLSKEVRVRFKTSGCYVATFGVKQYQRIFPMNIGITPINQFAFTTKPYRFRLAILIVFIVVWCGLCILVCLRIRFSTSRVYPHCPNKIGQICYIPGIHWWNDTTWFVSWYGFPQWVAGPAKVVKILWSFWELLEPARCMYAKTIKNAYRNPQKDRNGIRITIWVGFYLSIWGLRKTNLLPFDASRVSFGWDQICFGQIIGSSSWHMWRRSFFR